MTALEVHAVTPDRWSDLAELFGENGAYANCWCMWWRESAAEFDKGVKDRGAGNRAAMKALVSGGPVPGLLAYREGRPVGWTSVAPRPQFPRVERSPVLKPVDEAETWAVVCFYVPRSERGSGIATALLAAAVRHAADEGATLLEGYPSPPGDRRSADLYTGTESMFANAGFTEVARRKPTSRSIWRKALR